MSSSSLLHHCIIVSRFIICYSLDVRARQKFSRLLRDKIKSVCEERPWGNESQCRRGAGQQTTNNEHQSKTAVWIRWNAVSRPAVKWSVCRRKRFDSPLLHLCRLLCYFWVSRICSHSIFSSSKSVSFYFRENCANY